MKRCSRCKRKPALSYHTYCYTCLRLSKGQPAKPKFRRDATNKTKCSRCKKKPKAPRHNYCRQCRNAAVKKWAEKQGGYWTHIKADPERHKRALARKLIYNWVYRGKLKKGPCEVCGSRDSMAHHDDYDRPHDVRWLCQMHHDLADRAKEELDRSKQVK